MSNIVPLTFEHNVPAFAKGRSAAAQALAVAINTGVKRLSIKGGVFRYVVGGQEISKVTERHLDVIIINAAKSTTRTFYATTFDGNAKAQAPDCYSTDGIKPANEAKNKQHVNCGQCPKNVKGSGKGDSRACRYSQRLAVLLANDPSGEVLQLSVPAASLFGEGNVEAGATLQGYYKGLSARGVDPTALVTRLQFDTDAESPKIGFTAVRWLTEGEYAVAVEQGKSDAAIKAVTMTVHQADEVDTPAPLALPSGAPPSTMQAPAAPVAPVVVAAPAPVAAPAAPAASPAVAEPVVRSTASAGESATLQSLIAEWGTDDEPAK